MTYDITYLLCVVNAVDFDGASTPSPDVLTAAIENWVTVFNSPELYYYTEEGSIPSGLVSADMATCSLIPTSWIDKGNGRVYISSIRLRNRSDLVVKVTDATGTVVGILEPRSQVVLPDTLVVLTPDGQLYISTPAGAATYVPFGASGRHEAILAAGVCFMAQEAPAFMIEYVTLEVRGSMAPPRALIEHVQSALPSAKLTPLEWSLSYTPLRGGAK